MSKSTRLVSILLFLALVLSACNLPGNATEEPDGAQAVLTAAAQTVEANLTQAAVQNPTTQPTFAVVPTSTIAAPTVTLAGPSPTSIAPVATATSDCDDGDFVTDVTIPDGTVLDPNESFTKTWRLKNSGTCSWTPSYAVVFSNGDSMSGPATQALTGNVNPGQTMDISVNLKAPATAGDYTGYWKLRNAAGVTFATFYVTIKVGGGGPFAVTGVNYSVTGSCGGFHIVANITTNEAGTVSYYWEFNGNDPVESTYGSTLVFNAAGTKSTPALDWFITASGDHYARVYIDNPNHQFIGQANVHCP